VTRQPSNLVLWFGVLGGGAAWTVEFVTGLFFTWAQCNQPDGRTQLPLRAWQTGLAAAGALVGLTALGVCLRIYLHTHRIGDVAGEERRGDGHAPPLGRVHFLAVVGLTVNSIVIIIMVLTAIAAPNLAFCQQSS
jgi:hypothetical protein